MNNDKEELLWPQNDLRGLDRAWDALRREWVRLEPTAGVVYPLRDVDGQFSMTPDGRITADSRSPRYFRNEFEFPAEAFELPRPKLRVGAPIWVRDSESDRWNTSFFSRWSDNGVYAQRIWRGDTKASPLWWRFYRIPTPEELEAAGWPSDWSIYEEDNNDL